MASAEVRQLIFAAAPGPAGSLFRTSHPSSVSVGSEAKAGIERPPEHFHAAMVEDGQSTAPTWSKLRSIITDF